MLYTAQYRYPGRDRLDITVKGNDPAGKLYAPTWNMVSRYKKKLLTDGEYAEMYYALLTERWQTHWQEMTRLAEMVSGTPQMPERDITFVCFCPANTFCHRYLLVKWFQNSWSIGYGGERTGF